MVVRVNIIKVLDPNRLGPRMHCLQLVVFEHSLGIGESLLLIALMLQIAVLINIERISTTETNREEIHPAGEPRNLAKQNPSLFFFWFSQLLWPTTAEERAIESLRPFIQELHSKREARARGRKPVQHIACVDKMDEELTGPALHHRKREEKA